MPEFKSEGKKVKSTRIPPESTRQGEKPKSNPTVPQPKPEGKKVKPSEIPLESTRPGEKRKWSDAVSELKPEGKIPKAIHPVTESQGQGENPESDPMAPVPKRAGKKVKSKARHWTGGPALARHIPWPEVTSLPLHPSF